MQHGYADLATGDIRLTILRNQDGVVVRIADSAPPIDLKKVRSRDFSDLRPGGLGVHFIEALMDSAVFLPGPDGIGNVLEMTKRVGVSP
jgi:anti-sigma regulatory factor (Ser/Thr protein kinase)